MILDQIVYVISFWFCTIIYPGLLISKLIQSARLSNEIMQYNLNRFNENIYGYQKGDKRMISRFYYTVDDYYKDVEIEWDGYNWRIINEE